MNKNEIKHLLLLLLVSILVLIMPLFVFFTYPPLMLSLWMTGIFTLILMKRKNPEVTKSKKYQMFEKFLYFQIINWAFGYSLFIPELSLIALIILVTMLVLSINKKRRANPKFIKWAKYIGFHLFNLLLMIVLIHYFPNTGEEIFIAIPGIVFVNGGNAALYLILEPKLPQRRKLIIFFIAIVMMTMTTLSMFPQYDGRAIFDVIFGG